MPAKYFPELCIENNSKIVLMVLDGLGGMGGIPGEPGGPTELMAAKTPHLDNLAGISSLGSTLPVARGITPGSGPAHLALFGYDPLQYLFGRGALSVAGLGMEQLRTDLAARINFATIDNEGRITDRRAGRIPTETCKALCGKLEAQISIPNVEVRVLPEKEHRAAVIFRTDPPLSDAMADTDPQDVGVPAKPPMAIKEEGRRTENVVRAFVDQAFEILADETPANALLLRGFSGRPDLPDFGQAYRLRPAAIAVYPMYKGLAHLLGMELIEVKGAEPGDEIDALLEKFDAYNFFFVHIKGTDSRGEDGDFDGKVSVLEQVDVQIPRILEKRPECFVVAGDHSTPSSMKSHSWHPVPFLLHSRYCRTEGRIGFSEDACKTGHLGQFPAVEVMQLALAHAGRLEKFGA